MQLKSLLYLLRAHLSRALQTFDIGIHKLPERTTPGLGFGLQLTSNPFSLSDRASLRQQLLVFNQSASSTDLSRSPQSFGANII
ncbi:hypothetical protein D3C87_1835280 [compost metagenome]